MLSVSLNKTFHSFIHSLFLADPSNMGGLNLLLMAGQQFMLPKTSTCTTPEKEKRVMPPDELSPKSALLELAEVSNTGI